MVVKHTMTSTNIEATNVNTSSVTTANVVLQSQSKSNTSVALLDTVNAIASTITQSRDDTNAQELSNMSMFNINNSNGTNHMGAYNYHPLAIFYPTHDIQIRRAGAMSSNGTLNDATTTYFYLCEFNSPVSGNFTVIGRSNNISAAFRSNYSLTLDYIRDANGDITTWTLEHGKKYGIIIYSKPASANLQFQLQGRSYNYGMHFYSSSYGHQMLHATYFSASEPVIGNSYTANSGYAFYVPYVFVKY